MEEEKDRRSLSKEVLAEKLKKAEAEARQEAVRQASLCKQLEFMPSISLCDDSYKEEPGKYNWTRFGFDFQPFVSIVFLVLLITFISLTLLFPGQAESIFNKILDLITVNAGWFLILLATIFVVAILYFGLTKLGHVRLGGANAKPEIGRAHV